LEKDASTAKLVQKEIKRGSLLFIAKEKNMYDFKN